MASPVTLFIVEGESRDLRFAEKMKDLFLKGRDDLRVICLPEAQNIYMLYERLAEEDFDLDVVEVLRETFVDNSEIAQYKNKSGEGNVNVGKHMELPQWKDAIAAFVLRCKCLLGLDEVSFETYRELVTVDAIFREEKRMRIEDGSVFVLSAFPEFLLDYFGDKFFNSMAPMRHLKFDDCPRGNG